MRKHKFTVGSLYKVVKKVPDLYLSPLAYQKNEIDQKVFYFWDNTVIEPGTIVMYLDTITDALLYPEKYYTSFYKVLYQDKIVYLAAGVGSNSNLVKFKLC
jgi:hypothetical protein